MRSATGRARDFDAAASFALHALEYAPVQISEPEPGLHVWELVNTKGEPGWLRMEQDSPPSPDEDSVQAIERWQNASGLRISASLGRFGDARLEHRLIDAVARRLRELDKRGY